MDSKSQKTVIAVVLVLIFAGMMCCGGTLMLGAWAGYDEAKKAESTKKTGGGVLDDDGDVGNADPFPDDPGPNGEDEDDKRAFAQAVLDELEESGTSGYRYDPTRFELRTDGGVQLNLTNLYAEYKAAELDERPSIVQRTVRAMSPPPVPESWAEAAPQLKTAVRDRIYVELIQLRTQGSKVVSRPLADDLVETVVFDGPDTMLYVSDEHLGKWGKTADEALSRARANLMTASNTRFTAVTPGVWESPWADNFDTSRAALFDVIRKLKVKGEPVLFLPHRDHLIVTGSDDSRGLEAAIDLVDERLELPRANTGRGWKLTARGLEPWVPEDGSRAAFLRADAVRSDYNEQKSALEARFDADGTDVFVGTVLEVEDDDEGVHQYCVWTKGAQTLMPRAEYVVFVDLDKPEGKRVVAAARWEDVLSRMKDNVTESDEYWPRRYRVEGFPDARTLRSLGTISWFVRNQGD